LNNFSLYLVCFIVPLILGLAIQGWLKSTFAANSRKPISSGKSGADVAREILDHNGLGNVVVQPSKAGPLSDHYDPRGRTVNLSEPVFSGRSVASTAVAAHVVGHAIQHARSYVPMTLRSAVWPVASFGSQAWFFILIIGVFMGGMTDLSGGTASPTGRMLINVALVLFAAVVAFQFVTLPVEFNASRRAATQLREMGLVNEAEAAGVRKTLTAAAMTYVAGALAALAQLLFFLLRFGGR
jgi:Zn-dependent membrane protease YugP